MKLTEARPKEVRDLYREGIDIGHDLAVLEEHKTDAPPSHRGRREGHRAAVGNPGS